MAHLFVLHVSRHLVILDVLKGKQRPGGEEFLVLRIVLSEDTGVTKVTCTVWKGFGALYSTKLCQWKSPTQHN